MSHPSSGDDLPTDRRVARYQAELLRILHSGGEGVDMAEEIASAFAELDPTPRALDPTLSKWPPISPVRGDASGTDPVLRRPVPTC